MVKPLIPQEPREVPIEEIKCKKHACAFQYCLVKHNHDVEKCRGYFQAFEACASLVRSRQEAESRAENVQ